jgi:orotate phosphoribosyltransferase
MWKDSTQDQSAKSCEGDASTVRRVSLPTGELAISVTNADLPLDYLCGFAARQNPKRGFLFVSKVLGKHVPARPSVIRGVHRLLASKIPPNLPGPVVVVGLAETAILLGHGVFDAYIDLRPSPDSLFVHSTRYRLNRPCAVEFREEHSHATEHMIYLPDHPADEQLFRQAKSVVLVDDETSTGKTFVNLTAALHRAMPQLERVVTVVITDWRGPQATRATLAAMPVACQSVSLLAGEYSFVPAPGLSALSMPNVAGNGAYKDQIVSTRFGRCGINSHRQRQLRDDRPYYRPTSRTFERCLVVGTGEFVYHAFNLALQIEEDGIWDVRFQSTTRSPAQLGGAIERAFAFQDNYDDGIANFLYNVRPEDYCNIVFCCETPRASFDLAFLQALGAEMVCY